MSPAGRSGGRLLMDQLKINGAEVVFGVPGESFLEFLDAFAEADSPRMVTCRHEGGAAFAAEAWGRTTGRPGLCVVTRGPGATNASIGVHAARQSSTPMILLVGQVPTHHLGREAFQEVDLAAAFTPLAKWAAEIPSADRIPEFVSRAYHIAMSGRPGPVVLGLPEDVLSATSDVADARPAAAVRPTARAEDARAALSLLATAQRPLVVVGGSGWTQEAADDVRAWAEAWNLPVATELRCQDYVDNGSPSYAGELGLGVNPALLQRLADADVVLAIGGRLGDVPTRGYEGLDIPEPQSRLVHVSTSPDELGWVYRPELAIVADSPSFAALLRGEAGEAPSDWSAWTAAARADYLTWSEPKPIDWPVDLAQSILAMNDILSDDAIITNGAGNYAVWVQRYRPFTRYGTELGPISGAMGYGLPAALAAKIAHPERQVVAFAGDGCFMMTAQELATAVMQRLSIVIVVVNNSMLGTIRMYQEREHPGRVPGTELLNPDFVAYARSFGAWGRLVESTADFADAFREALAQDGPALLELRTDPAQLSPTFRVGT